jgi:hypothetical protein
MMMSKIEMIVTSQVSFGVARAQARVPLGSGEGVGDARAWSAGHPDRPRTQVPPPWL